MRRAEDHQPERPEEVGHGAGERRCEVVFGAIVPFEPRQHPGTELGFRRVGHQRGHDRGDLGTQRLPIERSQGIVRVPRPQLHAVDLVVQPEEVQMVGFGEVMVVAGHPEHRDDRSFNRGLEGLGEGDRRERLVDREQRTGEESRLLTGGDA